MCVLPPCCCYLQFWSGVEIKVGLDVLPRGLGVEVQLATVSDDEHTPIGHAEGGDSIQGNLCEALLAPLEADAKVRLRLLLVAHLRFTAARRIDATTTHTPRRTYGIATCHHGQSMWPVSFSPTNRTVRRTRKLTPPPAPEVPRSEEHT